MSKQIQMVCLDELVPANHEYRKFIKVFDFSKLNKTLKKIEKDGQYSRHKGYGVLRLFKCILIQHLEDLSFRELERFLVENVSAKWFCEFDLVEKVPDHSTLCVFSKKLGVNNMEKLFLILKKQLMEQGLMNEFFTVIDATHLIAKANLWEERDKAIKEKYEKLNNSNVSKFSADKDAKIGCKGQNRYWYGYKLSQSIDCQSGLINKVKVTPANVTDAKAMKYVLPDYVAIYGYKGYCTKQADTDCKNAGVTLRAIKKNNMIGKDFKFDTWISKIRSPYERMFSQIRRRVRYRSLTQNQMAAYLDAFSFNLKRLVVLNG